MDESGVPLSRARQARSIHCALALRPAERTEAFYKSLQVGVSIMVRVSFASFYFTDHYTHRHLTTTHTSLYSSTNKPEDSRKVESAARLPQTALVLYSLPRLCTALRRPSRRLALRRGRSAGRVSV